MRLRVLLGSVLFGLPVALAGAWIWLHGPAPETEAREGRPLPGGALVVWSPSYRVSFFGIERLHPFDIGKYDRIAEALVAEGLVPHDGFTIPAEATLDDLAAVHDPDWLEAVRQPQVLSRALEVPVPGVFPEAVVDRRVLAPMRRAAGGTVEAARGALRYGLGVNLGGGFHHALPDRGHGFCVYNDVALAVHALRRDGFAETILIVDTDAHQGDGNHAFFRDDPSVITLSLHQEHLFPQPRVPGDVDVELPAGTSDHALLSALDHHLERLLALHEPGLVIHVAGADVLHDDPLTDLAVTVDGLVERDLAVLRHARERHLPLVHLLAGGYGPSAAEAQARSVAAMLRDVRQPLAGSLPQDEAASRRR